MHNLMCSSLRDELSDVGEILSTERLTTIILGAFPAEKDSTIKIQTIRYPHSSLRKIEGMMKTIFINHTERSSVTKRSQQSYRKVFDSGRDSTMHDSSRESAMSTVTTCYNYNNPGYIMKECKQD